MLDGVRRWLWHAAMVGFVAVVACGHDAPDLLVVRFDAGSDAPAVYEAGGGDDGGDASPYLGAPCVDDAQCDDGIPCTYDSCDRTVSRCLNIPDDTQCDDGIYCNGKERCVPAHGCEPGTVVSCSDGNPCDIAQCVEATKSCTHATRDLDQDGDPDGHCAGGHDCNDLDPNVSSLHAEVCANGIDDNCNGLIDEMPCVTPQGDTCASAVVAAGAGTYRLSTVGGSDTFATTCSVTTPSAAQTVVAAVTVPPGPNVNLDAWATSNGGEVAVALDSTCGVPSSELACGSGPGANATSVRARAYDVPAGTYYAVVTTQSPAVVELSVDLLAPTPAPTNIDCAKPIPLQPGSPVTASLVKAPRSTTASPLPSRCPASTGELTYAFTLAQPQDVRVFVSALRGSGTPVIGLRDAACVASADELSCRVGSSTPIYVRSLPPGTYVVTVGASSPVDLSVDVELSAPSTPPPDQTCASPPSISANGTVTFDLSNHEDAIQDGCFPGVPDAAYSLALTSASDLLLIERVASSDHGAVSLDPPACTSSVGCSAVTGGGASSGVDAGPAGAGSMTPVRLGMRNVAAGDYRVVIADELGLAGTLDALVRPTVAPTILPSGAAGTCAAAVDASAGGFFTGDTSTATSNYTSGCDAPTSSGFPGQVLALNLAQPQRVVLDMEGSTYTTILDVRQGPACPGTPVSGGCYVGFAAQKSFLDLELPAGTFWLIVGGYQRASGAWNLDVRVLPP